MILVFINKRKQSNFSGRQYGVVGVGGLLMNYGNAIRRWQVVLEILLNKVYSEVTDFGERVAFLAASSIVVPKPVVA